MSELPYSPDPVPAVEPAVPIPSVEKDYSYQVALKKVAWALSKGIVAFLSGPTVAHYLNAKGISVTIDPNIIMGTIFGLLVYAHDYLKVHTNYTWL